MPLLISVLMLCKLIRTGSWFETTTDSFQSADCFLGIHALYQAGNTLCISGASTLEFHIADLAGIVDIKEIALAQTPDVLYTIKNSSLVIFNIITEEKKVSI